MNEYSMMLLAGPGSAFDGNEFGGGGGGGNGMITAPKLVL